MFFIWKIQGTEKVLNVRYFGNFAGTNSYTQTYTHNNNLENIMKGNKHRIIKIEKINKMT